jgi:hypothetical protein
MRVQGDKKVAFVLINLGPLPKMAAILDAEGMKLEGPLQSSQFRFGRRNQVDPEQSSLLRDQLFGPPTGRLQGRTRFELDLGSWHDSDLN